MKKVILILSKVLMIAIFLTSCGGSSNRKAEFSTEVKIGKQVWMSKNLNISRFRNGDSIPEAKTAKEWRIAGKNKIPAWCHYNNNPDNEEKFGKLYNWFAVNDPRGLAPEGWKIPSYEDWKCLTNFLGGDSVSGKKIKSSRFWYEINDKSGSGFNESRFSGLPGGRREENGLFVGGFEGAYFWTSTEVDSYTSWNRFVNYHSDNLWFWEEDKRSGLSVRCLKE